MTRVLVVNADDFGLTDGVNRGVARGHEEGIVTSASLMVDQRAVAEAAAYARARPTLSVGLHADLGEWRFRAGAWQRVYEVVPLDDADAIRDELSRQLERFCSLLGSLPTHLDSHQHVHRTEPARSVFAGLASDFEIVLRGEAAITHEGAFYGQTGSGDPLPDQITARRLTELVRRMPDGVTELSCHPAAIADMVSMYREERVRELAVLCDRRVREVIDSEGIVLAAFDRLPGSDDKNGAHRRKRPP